MNIDDFQYMWRGKIIRDALIEEAGLLAEVDIVKSDSGTALLLLHGFASSPAIYRELIPKLDCYDRIYCPVLPGHAESIQAFAKCSSYEWVQTALHSFEMLSKNYAKVDVLGLSLGGLLASIVASVYTPNHLYLLAPALKLYGMTGLRLFGAKLLLAFGLQQISNKAGDFYIDKYQELTYKKLPVHAIIEILNLVKNNQLSPIICQTDIFLGRHDSVVDSKAIEKIFHNKENTKIHWLDNSAHILPLDGDIQVIIDGILQNQKNS
ncbi:MAG: hypothetical protein A3E88_04825 [Legionellales bacterium RIFCSPHIGHO2_12_FULL_35_11]|nr:MAG: hypothetical protein A3E88_04825 [Legionellales bacterium RIFCSPHIGHO2_12_FULL_35_11]